MASERAHPSLRNGASHPWVLLAGVTLAQPSLRGRGAPPRGLQASPAVLVLSTRDPGSVARAGPARGQLSRPWQRFLYLATPLAAYLGPFVLTQAPPTVNGPVCASAWGRGPVWSLKAGLWMEPYSCLNPP